MILIPSIKNEHDGHPLYNYSLIIVDNLICRICDQRWREELQTGRGIF
jgi:hypothetical protein